MHKHYKGVVTRFLRDDERLMSSEANELPLVIEAVDNATSLSFLHDFLAKHSAAVLADIAEYGAVLLRGFDVDSDEAYEKTILSIEGFRPISEAFMAEEGRVHVDKSKYVLHTNSVYKTGGTLYLGGFHGENYYSPDVPAYICFCCFKPSTMGGETGLINMERVYACLDEDLIQALEEKTFFVSKWLLTDVMKRYHLSAEQIEAHCEQFGLPIIGKGKNKFILLYKPSIYEHPQTKKRALQINFFEIRGLNTALRQRFMVDYQGKSWFWHRFVWKLPKFIFKTIKFFYVSAASFFHSPKESLAIFKSKISMYFASKTLPAYDDVKVGQCFDKDKTQDLARHLRQNYSSCLWKAGDILLVDNRKVVHAGMPGSGSRLVRALICNPLEMPYAAGESGIIPCKERSTGTIGSTMLLGQEK
jgi:alpha-ketoglutarate-dependent taurine dioxygenase